MDPCRKIFFCYAIITIIFSVLSYIAISLYLRNTLHMEALRHDLECFRASIDETNTEDTFGQESLSTGPDMSSVEKQLDIMKNEISITQSNVNRLENRLSSMNGGVSATARPDFASELLGGRVEHVEDEPHCLAPFLLRIFGYSRITNAPQSILNSDMSPGNCYAFKGNKSIVIIKLMDKVFVDSVSIEHITEAVSPVGDTKSAPKDFSVYGLRSSKEDYSFTKEDDSSTKEDDSSTKEDDDFSGKNIIPLGSFSYNAKSGAPMQTFTVKTLPESYEYIKFNFTDNHGHPNYTCIYRIRVFGKLDKH